MKTKIFIFFFFIFLNSQNGYSQLPLLINALKNKTKEKKNIPQSEPKIDTETKNSDYYLSLAIEDLKIRNSENYKSALGNLKESLLLDSNNTNAQGLASQTNYDFALYSLDTGESKLKQKEWNDGFYFYRALENFSNAYFSGFKKTEIIDYVQKINLITQTAGERLKKFDESNLYKISTPYQRKNSIQIDSIKKVLSEKKLDKNIDKKELISIYTKLAELAEYQFWGNQFEGYDYQIIRREKALLEIEIGDLNNGCPNLYKGDLQYFLLAGYPNNDCKAWYEKFSKIEEEKYNKQRKEEAKKWYIEHPNMIKLRSLLGENAEVVETYFGKPIARNYKINIGTDNQYIGNKYKNKNGIYEIGLQNDNVAYVKFYPATYIKYSPQVLGGEKSNFDIQITIQGACSGSDSNSFIGKTKIFSMDYDCSNNVYASTQFYGLNGKLLFVTAY